MSEPDIHDIEEVGIDSLVKEVDSLLLDSWRLVQIFGISTATGYELDYTFGGGYAMRTLRVHLGPKDPVPSITSYYPAAVLYENEIRELFGIRIERIHPDWRGDLLGGGGPGKPFSRVRLEATSVERPVPLTEAIKPIQAEGGKA